MTMPLNSIYQEIGDEIAISIPEEWKSASVVFEFSSGVFTIQGRYVPKSGGNEQGFVVNKNIISHLQNLHTQMAETPKGNWKTARFELQRNGQFDLQFEY